MFETGTGEIIAEKTTEPYAIPVTMPRKELRNVVLIYVSSKYSSRQD